jgi:hypothetical protein
MQDVTEYLQSRTDKVDVLITIGSAGRTLVGMDGLDKAEKAARTEAAYREQWQRYAGLFTQQVVLRDTPKFSPTMVTCLGRHSATTAGAACSLKRTTALRPDYAALAAANDSNPVTRAVDLSDVFCGPERCSPVVGGYIAYSDPVHLHSVFVPTLAPLLDDRIKDAIRPAAVELLYGTTTGG